MFRRISLLYAAIVRKCVLYLQQMHFPNFESADKSLKMILRIKDILFVYLEIFYVDRSKDYIFEAGQNILVSISKTREIPYSASDSVLIKVLILLEWEKKIEENKMF